MLIPGLILSADGQPVGTGYTEQIRKRTTKPCFLTELVDHLGAGRSKSEEKAAEPA